MKKKCLGARAEPAQQDLFAKPRMPLAIAPATLEEVRAEMAELLLDALETSGKERAGESEDH